MPKRALFAGAMAAALVFEVFQQVREDLGPSTVATPAPEAAVDGLPGAIALGDIAPGGTGVQTPKDTVKDASVILQGAPATLMMRRVREK